MEIKYSFVVPHKNAKALLLRCVNSIPLRSDVEIIIIDDNSKESQKPIIDCDRIKVVHLSRDESKGAGHARNVGLSLVTGEWVLFPDSDDYYVEGFLDVLDSINNNDIDIVYFNCIYKDGQTGRTLPKLSMNCDFENYDGSISSIDTIKYHHNAPWTKMIRSSYIKKHNFSFEEVVNGNDLFFSMSVGYCTNNIKVLKEPMYCYLRNANSLTKKKLTPSEALCVVQHTAQMNEFYKFIGHREWILPIFRIVLIYIHKGGFSIFRILFRNIPNIIKRRKGLVSFVCSK